MEMGVSGIIEPRFVYEMGKIVSEQNINMS
jgi:hypothetical protein